MRASTFVSVLIDKRWLTYIYFLLTLIACVQAAFGSSIKVGLGALAGFALSYFGTATYIGSVRARKDLNSTKGTLIGINAIALVLNFAGLGLVYWSEFRLWFGSVEIIGLLWALVGIVIAVIATRKQDVQ